MDKTPNWKWFLWTIRRCCEKYHHFDLNYSWKMGMLTNIIRKRRNQQALHFFGMLSLRYRYRELFVVKKNTATIRPRVLDKQDLDKHILCEHNDIFSFRFLCYIFGLIFQNIYALFSFGFELIFFGHINLGLISSEKNKACGNWIYHLWSDLIAAWVSRRMLAGIISISFNIHHMDHLLVAIIFAGINGKYEISCISLRIGGCLWIYLEHL
jgi:hypothetical protein